MTIGRELTVPRTCAWITCLLAAANVASAACGSSAASSSGAAAQTQTSAPKNKPIANVCDGKIITPADVASVLPGSINVKTLEGDPQTCEYQASGFSHVSITVRPGLGDITVAQWANGGVSVDSAAVSGIGDRARWQSTLHELIGTKHNVLCDIGAEGVGGSEADLQKKLGQLCDKIWAAQ
jgi:hypothetical protein